MLCISWAWAVSNTATTNVGANRHHAESYVSSQCRVHNELTPAWRATTKGPFVRMAECVLFYRSRERIEFAVGDSLRKPKDLIGHLEWWFWVYTVTITGRDFLHLTFLSSCQNLVTPRYDNPCCAASSPADCIVVDFLLTQLLMLISGFKSMINPLLTCVVTPSLLSRAFGNLTMTDNSVGKHLLDISASRSCFFDRVS